MTHPPHERAATARYPSIGFIAGQSGEARIFLIQDDNLTAEVPLRRSILQSTLRQKYRSTGRHNPQRDGGPEKGLYRLHPIALGFIVSRPREAKSLRVGPDRAVDPLVALGAEESESHADQ